MAATPSSSAIPQWQVIGQAKRDEVRGLLPSEWKINAVPAPEDLRDVTNYARQFLTTEEREITEAPSATSLLARVARGELTAVQVTKAFCHRATIAHQVVSQMSPA